MLLIGSAWMGEACGLTSLLGALWGGVLMARVGPVEGEVQRVLTVLSEVFLSLYFIRVGIRISAGTLVQSLIDAVQFSSLVLMVTFTTVVGLLLLERRLQRGEAVPERLHS
jgi:Kef-type K+ transport system membrane component KefB